MLSYFDYLRGAGHVGAEQVAHMLATYKRTGRVCNPLGPITGAGAWVRRNTVDEFLRGGSHAALAAWARRNIPELKAETERREAIAKFLDYREPKFIRVEPGVTAELWHPQAQQMVTFNLERPLEYADTKITQAQFEGVMGRNPSHAMRGGDYPAESMGTSVFEYLRRLNAEDPAHHYRFPSGLEWMYMATDRGLRSKQVFADWGAALLEQSWIRENSEDTLHEVATRKPTQLNGHDIYDVFGLVCELASADATLNDSDLRLSALGGWYGNGVLPQYGWQNLFIGTDVEGLARGARVVREDAR